MMAKWAWKMLVGQGGLWLDIIRHKYLRHAPVSTASCRNGSQFWKSIVKIRHLLRVGAVHCVGNGKSTVFWLDVWLGQDPLANAFPNLFAVTTNPNALVCENWRNGQWCPQFRCSLGPLEMAAWDQFANMLRTTSLTSEPDTFRWKLEPSGQFTTSSLYRALHNGAAPFQAMDIWKAGVPTKVKIFLWQLVRDRLPIGVHVQARHGPGDGRCPLCGAVEEVDHIFFKCILAQFLWGCIRDATGCSWAPASFGAFHTLSSRMSGRSRRITWLVFAAMAWALWQIRNKALIEGKFIKHPADAMYKMTIFLQLWVLLSKSTDASTIEELIHALRTLAARLRRHREDAAAPGD